MKKFRAWHLSLGWQILLGLIIGIALGALFYENQKFITISTNIGDSFINLISMVVLPIVMSSLIVGIANMGDLRKLGRIGVKTLIYFEVLSTIAFIIGMTVSNIAHLGSMVDLTQLNKTDISSYLKTAKTSHSDITSVLMSIIPTNIFEALNSGDMLPVVFFSALFGLGLASIGEKGQVVIDFLNAVSATMFKITGWVMHVAPLGVAGLIGATIAKLGLNSLKPLSLFIIMAYATMIFFILVILGLTSRLFGFRIIDQLIVVKDELILAFTTASSEVTLPRLIDKSTKLGVNQSIGSFVIPTGYTFNLDGSAIYQGLAAIFVAQAYHIHLSFSQQLTLLVVLMLTSKGMAGTPGASFVVLLASVGTVGIPTSGIALIAGIDRLVDMGRTVVNVIGNMTATLIIGKSENEFDQTVHDAYVEKMRKKL
ncbi:cation:dicarboxylase symporter family transporter [Ligilactobacillus sp. WILCCON 0076]|uniref:Cation:dicarboxylase symporter family transporter n=1 Tax=Ligilactobacillus ubinensis TaxID=2876789 RepID=A0A9X2FLU5_9LACO|nr:cation:dicarboxylase symporter family transporter [Ligilactobacillus ubinensis]MCP0887735.1 cation:dicarboxylase symporter family transporter [Ligilactobacillus ubinensis]